MTIDDRHSNDVPPEPEDGALRDSASAASAIADERVVHALLRSLAPSEAAATAHRVDRAMAALAELERDRFSLRMRRVVAPWLARGAAAAAMLMVAVIVTRMATAPTAYAELAAIASATQSMPFRRYAVVSEHTMPNGHVMRRHGTLDLGPEGRFVALVARPEDDSGVVEAMVERILSDDRILERLRERGWGERVALDPVFRERFLTDPAFREQTLRDLIRIDGDGGPARSPRAESASGTDAAKNGDAAHRPRHDRQRRVPGAPGRSGPGGAVGAGEPHPSRLRPPRGRFDPWAIIGHDGDAFWLVPSFGPVYTSASSALLQGRIELADGLDQLNVDRVLDRLRDGYRLQLVELDEHDPDSGMTQRILRIDAVRIAIRDGVRGGVRETDRDRRRPREHGAAHAPDTVTVRARADDRLVIALDAQWIEPDSTAPHRRLVIELLDEPPPAHFGDLSWFSHAEHHHDDRPVLTIDDEEIARRREMRQRSRSE